MFWPLQQQGSTGESVRSVQYLLNANGATLTVDGIFGPLTAAAVTSFQSGRGLAADGIVGDQTWPTLIVPLSSGNTGDAVSAVQSQINSRSGWLTISGTFDAQTANAVQWFQQPLGLTVDGTVTWYVWRALLGDRLWATGGNEASTGLFNAWMNNDQIAAGKYATPSALAAIFSQSWSASANWTFSQCLGAAGHFICSWSGTPGTLTLEGNDNTGAPFYYVQNVTF